ncbi:hypothetical protein QQ045_008641 [Rhodiola kirilowii]
MNFKAFLLIISASLIAFSTLAFEPIDTTNLYPTWIKIADLSKPHVLTIARFAVEQHNTEASTYLQLLEVVSGYRHIGEGMKYRLILRVANLDTVTVTNYETLVHEKEAKIHKELVYFRKALQ